MLDTTSHSALTETLTRNLGELYLGQARTEKEKGHLDVALPLYDQLKETLKSLGSVKEALRQAQYPHTLADETLRAMMADAYFERGEVLEGLKLFAKARSSYFKAGTWGHTEAKHRVEAGQSPPSEHSAHSSGAVLAKTAHKKSELVDYLFEKALLTLSSLEVSNKPSIFLVYAHDNRAHGEAEAGTSKYLINNLSKLGGVQLHSDQAPMGRPYSISPEELKEEGRLGDILINQLCLLPARLIKDVKPVNKVVVCCSAVLGSYLKWQYYDDFYEELGKAYHEDLEAYSKNGEQKDSSAIRKVVIKFSEDEKYKAEFHHVLTEIAFLQIRAKQLENQHGIIPVSLTPNSYDDCLGRFITPTVVRMEDISRFKEQAEPGREARPNQGAQWVLFKLIERLLVSSDEARTFLDKFWQGCSDFISHLESNSTLGELGFARLLDGIFEAIQSAQRSQLAVIMREQNQQRWVLRADPQVALREQYLAALKQDEAFEQILQLYVEPRGQVSLDRSIKTVKLLPQVQEFLKDKQVILLTGDSGAGKTTFNRRLEKQLWEDKKGDDDAIPLFISLSSIDKPEHDLIDKALKKKELSEFQIQKLKKEGQRFVFILDGYDEIRQTQNLYVSNSINQSGGWKGQMVISCRSEYLGQDYRSRFQPNPSQQDEAPSFQEVVVEPFSEDEQNQYLKKYVQLNPKGWTVEEYQEVLKKDKRLKDLVSNPFLLRVVLDALPYLENDGKARSAIQSRLDLYDQFVRLWFKRNQQRLSAQDLTGPQRASFKALCDDGFAEHGIAFVQELAVHLYTENAGSPVVEYSLLKDKGNWKGAFFGRNEENQLLREAWPLSRSGNQYRFIHKSLLEYFVVRTLFDSFDDCLVPDTRHRRGSDASVYSFDQAVQPRPMLRDVPLAPKHWLGDLGVIRLLSDRVWQEPLFKKQLLAIIERSKTHVGVRQTAANAMTLLVKAGVQFNGADLKGIQIPGADLSYGVFDSAQLQGADLRGVKLCNIGLRGANLSRARMAGVQFGELPFLQENQKVTSCAYSPDGKTFAMGLEAIKIRVYSTSNWEKIQTLRGYCSGFAYSPKGDQIASGGRDDTVRLWDVAAGVVGLTLKGHSDAVKSVVYSPKGDQLASGSKDKTVRQWDAQTGICLRTLSGHSDAVRSVAYSPTGDQLASGSFDKTVRLWDAQEGACLRILSGHRGDVNSVVYSPTGDQLASGSSDCTVRLWDAETGAAGLILSGHSNKVKSIVYSPIGDQLASGSFDKTVRQWDVKTGTCLRTLSGHDDNVTSVVYSSKGNQLVSGSDDHTVRLWFVETGASGQHTLGGHSSAVTSVVYSPPTGAQIASGSDDHTVRLCDAKTGTCLRTLSGHSKKVRSVVYSPTGAQLASGSWDSTVRLWDVQTGTCLRTLSGHKDYVTSVAYSPTGDQLASGSWDHTVRQWDAQTGNCLRILSGHTNYVSSVVYSPTGDELASGDRDYTVRQWDAKTGDCLRTLSVDGAVLSVVYSPKGDQLAIGQGANFFRVVSNAKKLQLWDAQTGTCLHTLSGHNGDVNSVVYSPTGDQLASGSSDNTVRLWDVETGQCQMVIEGFNGEVWGVAWKKALKGDYLVTGSVDCSVRQWQLVRDEDNYKARLCWRSSHQVLNLVDTVVEDVQDLSEVNKRLLEQRVTGRENSIASDVKGMSKEMLFTLKDYADVMTSDLFNEKSAELKCLKGVELKGLMEKRIVGQFAFGKRVWEAI